MSNQQEQQQQQAFLSSLHEATELSIQLTQHSSSRNATQGVFRLELSSTKADDSFVCSCSLERMGIRDPASTWPAYTYKVDATLIDFMMHKLLPAIHSSCTAALQALTLSGCGRIPGFYPALVKILGGATALSSLSVLHWTDFCTSMASPEDDALQLFSRLRHLNVHQYKLNSRCSQTGTSLGAALASSPLLESLNITTTGSITQDRFWQSMARGISQLQHLKQLSWSMTTNTTSPISADASALLCAAISSRPLLEKLELSWPGMQPQHLVALLSLNSTDSQQPLSSLTLHQVTEECSTMLGQYLLDRRSSEGLQELKVSFLEDCNGLNILEGVLRHDSLTTLALHGLHMDNDVAKTLQMMCLYNTTLTNLQVIVSGSSDEMDTDCTSSHVQDVLIGLVSNETLQSVVLGSTSTEPTVLDEYTSLALCDVLQDNVTLQQLTLPNLQLAAAQDSNDSVVAFHVAQGIANNATLQRLYGIDFTNQQDDLLLQALHYNKVLVDMSHKSPLVSFLLQLNQLGRQHWVEPNFEQQLLPHLLTKSDQTPASIQCILQTCLSYTSS